MKTEAQTTFSSIIRITLTNFVEAELKQEIIHHRVFSMRFKLINRATFKDIDKNIYNKYKFFFSFLIISNLKA